MPEIKQVYADNPTGFKYASKRKYFICDTSIDQSFLYPLLQNNGLYFVDKNTGEFVKRIKFDIETELGGTINRISAESPDYIFGYNARNGVIVKFEK